MAKRYQPHYTQHLPEDIVGPVIHKLAAEARDLTDRHRELIRRQSEVASTEAVKAAHDADAAAAAKAIRAGKPADKIGTPATDKIAADLAAVHREADMVAAALAAVEADIAAEYEKLAADPNRDGTAAVPAAAAAYRTALDQLLDARRGYWQARGIAEAIQAYAHYDPDDPLSMTRLQGEARNRINPPMVDAHPVLRRCSQGGTQHVDPLTYLDVLRAETPEPEQAHTHTDTADLNSEAGHTATEKENHA
jgi:hypothetical protein